MIAFCPFYGENHDFTGMEELDNTFVGRSTTGLAQREKTEPKFLTSIFHNIFPSNLHVNQG
jgi:hypothetical protein